MTTIQNRTTPLPPDTDAMLGMLGPEGQLEAILVALQDAEHDDEALARAATERRFDAAEEAIEHKRRATRASFAQSVIGGLGSIAQGVGGMAAGFGVDAEATAASEDVRLTQTARRTQAVAGLVGSTASATATVVGVTAARAEDSAAAAQLASTRAEERASRLDGNARAEQDMRNSLLRALDQLAETRRRGDDAVFRDR